MDPPTQEDGTTESAEATVPAAVDPPIQDDTTGSGGATVQVALTAGCNELPENVQLE